MIRVSRGGTTRADLEDPASIDALFATVGEVDAVVCCAAGGRLAPLVSSSDEDFTHGLESKLLGQVRLLRRALEHVRDGGSITLTGGTFEKPTPGSAFGALVNAGLEAFVRAAAIEMPRGLRVNVISPGWVRRRSKSSAWTAPTARRSARSPAPTSRSSRERPGERSSSRRPGTPGSSGGR
ncbi:SDR family oxidoreductase [Streptosporangium lutulentum]